MTRWPNRSPAERFWAKVQVQGNDECWPWTGTRNALGYGNFDRRPAHRVAYQLTFLIDPIGYEVMHLCDNPPCVNPAHLSLGTHADNLRQASERGRFRIKVSDWSVIELRERVAEGESVASVARDLGIGYSTAKKMVKGWLRPHLPGPLTRPRQRTGVGR